MAGRPRKPSNVLELNGAFKKDPARGRARADEPVVTTDIGEPPKHLRPEVVECWNEIVAQAPARVLTGSDRLIVEYTAEILYLLRYEGFSANTALLNRFETALGKLGMTPSDRSKVSATKSNEQKNPYAEFG